MNVVNSNQYDEISDDEISDDEVSDDEISGYESSASLKKYHIYDFRSTSEISKNHGNFLFSRSRLIFFSTGVHFHSLAKFTSL